MGRVANGTISKCLLLRSCGLEEARRKGMWSRSGGKEHRENMSLIYILTKQIFTIL